MTFDVLISHSTADKAISSTVCDRLEMAGIRCWIAPRNIAAGTEWTAAILEGINSSRMMLLVFSESANASKHVQREILYASENKLPILPVRIQQTVPTGSLAYCLLGVQWFDALTPPLDQHITSLIVRVRSILSELATTEGKVDPTESCIGLPPISALPKARDVFFECSECGRSMVIDAAAAGTAVDCIFCEKEVVVPGAAVRRKAIIEPAVLAQITERLGHVLGPISRHLVKTTAADTPSLYDLCHDLAGYILDTKERANFLHSVGDHARSAPTPATHTDPLNELPASSMHGPVSWSPEVLKRIKSELAIYIGPVAGVLVERTSKEAANPRELCEKLASHLHAPKEREQWLRSAASFGK